MKLIQELFLGGFAIFIILNNFFNFLKGYISTNTGFFLLLFMVFLHYLHDDKMVFLHYKIKRLEDKIKGGLK